MKFDPVRVALADGRIFRSLQPSDVDKLAAFYDGLSEESRSFWHRDPNGQALAVEHCEAIDRYDKLRMVVDGGTHLAAIYELSFAITRGDFDRYLTYGVTLSEESDVRFGPCVHDSEKGSGLAVTLLAETARVAIREGRSNLILWGGVQPENTRARRFYVREGFEEVGQQGGIIDMMRPA